MQRDSRRAAQVSLRRIAVATAALGALLLPSAIGADPGFVPGSHGVAGEVVSNHQRRNAALAGSAGNLTYHGGPVLHSNTTYAIYWGSIDPGYESTINQFFGDVASDSARHATSNVYSTDPQYTDSGGPAQYDSTYGGSWSDTSTPIPNDCSGEYPRGATVTGCALDSDIQAEVSRALAANHWTGGLNHIFFVFTPKNVGSCVDSTSRQCAFTDYCAYHWFFTQNGTPVLYTDQPYTDTSGVGTLYADACDSGQQPNGSWADSTINVASHEHNEVVTDPEGDAWYDSVGDENGDKCAWMFGTALGGAQGSQWNQVINGHHYFLQQEWSNASSGCALSTGSSTPPPAAPPTVTGFNPSSGSSGTLVTISGTNLTGATAVRFNGVSSTFSVVNPTTLTATVPSSAGTGPISVTTPAGSGTSSANFDVTAPGFSIQVAPTGRAVRRGSSTSYTVRVNSGSGFTGSVRLSVSGLPSGASASFSPTTIAGGLSVLTISAPGTTSLGTRILTITGTSGTIAHSASAVLTVTN